MGWWHSSAFVASEPPCLLLLLTNGVGIHLAGYLSLFYLSMVYQGVWQLLLLQSTLEAWVIGPDAWYLIANEVHHKWPDTLCETLWMVHRDLSLLYHFTKLWLLVHHDVPWVYTIICITYIGAWVFTNTLVINRSRVPVLIWVNSTVVVHVVFQEILTLTRLQNIVTSKGVIVQKKLFSLVTYRCKWFVMYLYYLYLSVTIYIEIYLLITYRNIPFKVIIKNKYYFPSFKSTF